MARVDYDRMAPDYVEGRALPPEGLEPWRQAIRSWLPEEVARRSPLLDLGAGTGQFAAAIAGWFGVEVVAVEPSGGMRAEAARAHPHPGVAWVAGVGERMGAISLYERFFPGAGAAWSPAAGCRPSSGCRTRSPVPGSGSRGCGRSTR